jgi:hypothetical protein
MRSATFPSFTDRWTGTIARVGIGCWLLLVLVSTPAAAGMCVIDLPALTGDYEAAEFAEPNFGWPFSRTTDFAMPPEVTAIDQMKLVVSGTWTEGIRACEDPFGGPPHQGPFLPGLSLYLTSEALPEGDFFHATVPSVNGTFSGLQATFQSCCPGGTVDPNLLVGSQVHAEFFTDWVMPLICNIIQDSYGTITEVRLEVTGVVPVEDTTWGAVKQLYR